MLLSVLFAGIVIFNEDNSHFLRDVPEKEYVRYFDSVCKGGVTHFFMCPNCQRSNIRTKSLEPMWENQKPAAYETPGWVKTTKHLDELGIDPYAIWIRRAREKGVSPWLSMRMNECHEAQNPDFAGHATFWRAHPEFRRTMGVAFKNWTDGCFDYSHAEVREHHASYVKELLERYDPDGIEIDWLRFPYHLTPHKEREQAHYLTEVMRKVRQYADEASARRGRRIKVAARVQSTHDVCQAIGTDAVIWAKEGLIDVLIVCNFFATADFGIPYAEWKRLVGAVNPKVTIIPGLDSGAVKDRTYRQLMTLDEYRGWCENLYAQGAPGIYLFNPFHYAEGSPQWKAFTEGGLGPEDVAKSPRAYPVTYHECAINGASNGMQLPRSIAEGVKVCISIGHAPKEGVAEVALAFDDALTASERAGIRLNGQVAEEWREISPASFLDAKTKAKVAYLARFPVMAVKDGENVVTIEGVAGSTRHAIACELYLNGAQPGTRYSWRVGQGDDVKMQIPDEEGLRFPDGFKATVRFACDLSKIGARAFHANLFTKGNDFQDGYNVMVRKDGKLLIDLKGITPDYAVRHTKIVSGQKHLLEIYVRKTPKVVRIFLDGKETDSYPYTEEFDFSAKTPLKLGSMGSYKFSGTLDEVTLEDIRHVTVPSGGPKPLPTVAPKQQARAEILWTRTIAAEPGRYIGWPSVVRLKNGDVLAVFSGDREEHVCPFGKVQMVRSKDNGETWSAIETIANGPIDDRDAGIVQLPDGRIVVTYFTSVAYRTDSFLAGKFKKGDNRIWWKRHDEKIPDDVRKAALGYYRMESRDDGRTWSKPEKMTVSHAPHGPSLLNDGTLLQLGRSFTQSAQGEKEVGRTIISAWKSEDAARTWTCLCPEIADMNGENAKPHMFHEPNCIQLPNGKIVGLVRYHGDDNCMRQTDSLDGGKTWTPMRKTGMLGLPPHLIRLADGKLVCVFGRRFVQPTSYGEYAVISDDDGATWDVAHEILLHPAANGDLGYPASCVLADGSILTVYYQTPKSKEKPQLMATKWRVTK